MGTSNRTIIQALLLATAIIAMLLSTPSLEAKTRSKKHHFKKTKIVFDGTESHSSAQSGELGDEIVRPQSGLRDVAAPTEVVRTRGNSIDDLWDKNRASTSGAKPSVADENPDLIQPVWMNDVDERVSRKSHTKTDLANGPSSIDESSLGSFKKSKRAKAKFVVSGPAVAKTLTKPVDKPVLFANKPTLQRADSSHLAARFRKDEPTVFRLNAAFETTVTLGRKYQLEARGDRNYAMKNELFFGTIHSSGWGAKVSVDYVMTANDDSSKDTNEMGDPSLIVLHPSVYKTDFIDVAGGFRYYAPVAAASKSVGLQQFAYYSLTDIRLPAETTISNALISRYFQQTSYLNTDAFALVSDSSELARKLNLFRLGLGQKTQIESHEAVAPGTTAEIYPFVDFLGISNALIETKFYLPVFVNGIVTNGPVAASISNLQAEFVMKLSF